MLSLCLSCGNSHKERAETPATAAEAQKSPEPSPVVTEKPAPSLPPGVVAIVNGHQLTKAQFDAELQKNLKALKNKIPKGKNEEVSKTLKRRIIDEFITKSLLKDEVDQQKSRPLSRKYKWPWTN